METVGVISISIIGILIFILVSNNQRKNILIFIAFIFLVRFCNSLNENKSQPNNKIEQKKDSRGIENQTKIVKPIKSNFYNKSENNYTTRPKKTYQRKNKTRVIVGAECYDGTISNSTGSGTCSHHGGVRYWLYEEQ